MNATKRVMIARLPRKPLLSLAEVSAAMGLASAKAAREAVDEGRLEAVKAGNRWLVAREEAARWISTL